MTTSRPALYDQAPLHIAKAAGALSPSRHRLGHRLRRTRARVDVELDVRLDEIRNNKALPTPHAAVTLPTHTIHTTPSAQHVTDPRNIAPAVCGTTRRPRPPTAVPRASQSEP